ncbi:PREDICTED: phosphatidylinositol transfer protein alpha isoform [Elephantulus edwardii]|uniref:phosphatidylinositol transfer protein alpha isoform n=1 Tax=Elephantulus edwardii TaxID=28737 RepID=UPI0003F06E18|nr:PREDICTED: phosphatidylinositol transfer protein alpha isoform [Elephantulus edwardii]
MKRNYQVGQLYSVAEASKNETGGGEGVEVLVNEPYEKDGEKGQYTHKIYHLQSKVPTFVRMLAPEGALNIHEKAWNAYPYCRTGVSNLRPKVHKLEPETWKHVEAVYIDIADRSQVLSKDYKAEEDPSKFKSSKTGRGPLGPNWKQELVNQKDCPYMCAYKLVTVKFKWWGLQNKVENFIHKQEKRLFTNFHRQLFCWLDKWVDLTMDDIRRMEEETKKQLDEPVGVGRLGGPCAEATDLRSLVKRREVAGQCGRGGGFRRKARRPPRAWLAGSREKFGVPVSTAHRLPAFHGFALAGESRLFP